MQGSAAGAQQLLAFLVIPNLCEVSTGQHTHDPTQLLSDFLLTTFSNVMVLTAHNPKPILNYKTVNR